ncbi:MAG: hypothetical protein ACFBZ8_04635 [Opitutales bacterium]
MLKTLRLFALAAVICASAPIASAELSVLENPMTAERLFNIIKERADEPEQRGNTLLFDVAGIPFICIVDEQSDRMRLMAPVTKYSDVTPQQRDRMLEANFSTALDARYCVNADIVYAAYLHPLSPLQEAQVLDAVMQVATLKEEFGKSYASSRMAFGGSGEPPEPDPSL